MAVRSIAASSFLVAACALTLAPTVRSEIRTVPIPESPCDLPTARSLIIWQHAPGAQDRSAYVNESDIYTCRPTIDTWRAGQPTGPGYCSKIGWAVDNPGYVSGVEPAAALRKVIDQVGDC